MNSFRLALLGATFLVGAAGAVSAADINQRGSLKDTPEVYYPPITWTGFYIGAHAGGAFGGELDFGNGKDKDKDKDDDKDKDNDKDKNGKDDSAEDLDNAFTGGVHLGYNWQASENWVIGLEGSISALALDAEDDFEWSDYVASIQGRAGVAFDQNLVYGTAGVAFLGYADDAAEELDDDTAVGFVIGAGWERKITENVSFGVEGLYYNFESDLADSSDDVETDFFTVTARLSYHFTSDRDAPLK